MIYFLNCWISKKKKKKKVARCYLALISGGSAKSAVGTKAFIFGVVDVEKLEFPLKSPTIDLRWVCIIKTKINQTKIDKKTKGIKSSVPLFASIAREQTTQKTEAHLLTEDDLKAIANIEHKQDALYLWKTNIQVIPNCLDK